MRSPARAKEQAMAKKVRRATKEKPDRVRSVVAWAWASKLGRLLWGEQISLTRELLLKQ